MKTTKHYRDIEYADCQKIKSACLALATAGFYIALGALAYVTEAI